MQTEDLNKSVNISYGNEILILKLAENLSKEEWNCVKYIIDKHIEEIDKNYIDKEKNNLNTIQTRTKIKQELNKIQIKKFLENRNSQINT